MNALSLSLNLQAELVSRVISTFFGCSFQKYPDYLQRFQKFCLNIFTSTQVSTSVVFLALLYFKRLYQSPNFREAAAKIGSEFSIFSISLMLASKYLDDNTFTSKTWAKVALVPVPEFLDMQNEFLRAINYKLYVEPTEYYNWSYKLDFFFNSYSNPNSPVQFDSNNLSVDNSFSSPCLLSNFNINPNQTYNLSSSNSNLGKRSRNNLLYPSNTKNIATPALSNFLQQYQTPKNQAVPSFSYNDPLYNLQNQNNPSSYYDTVSKSNKKPKFSTSVIEISSQNTPSYQAQALAPIDNPQGLIFAKENASLLINNHSLNPINSYPHINSGSNNQRASAISNSNPKLGITPSNLSKKSNTCINTNKLPSIIDFYYNGSPDRTEGQIQIQIQHPSNLLLPNHQLQNLLTQHSGNWAQNQPKYQKAMGRKHPHNKIKPNYQISGNNNNSQNKRLADPCHVLGSLNPRDYQMMSCLNNSDPSSLINPTTDTNYASSKAPSFSNLKFDFSSSVNTLFPNNSSILPNHQPHPIQFQLSQPCFY